MTRYWLMKCEPTAYTIDDLKRDRRTSWEGVRNYQARNFMRDDMQVGDACPGRSRCHNPVSAFDSDVVQAFRPA